MVLSGVPANNGVVLSDFIGVSAPDQTRAVFQGRTSAVVLSSAGTLTNLITTGAAAPAPVIGTFNEFFDPAQTDGNEVVFRATLNSATSDDFGIFHRDGFGVITPVALSSAFNPRDPADINNSAQIVWLDRGQALYRWIPPALGGPTNTAIAVRNTPAPGGGNWRRFGRYPVIGDSGSVAFMADLNAGGQDGVFFWNAANGLITAIAQTGGTSPIAGTTYGTFRITQAVAVNALDQVVFTAQLNGGTQSVGVFQWDVATGLTTTIATDGSPAPIGAPGPISDIDDEYVGIDPIGQIGFEASFGTGDSRLILNSFGTQVAISPTLGGAASFAPRLTLAGITSWRSGSAIETNGPGPSIVQIVNSATVTPIGQNVQLRRSSPNNLGDVVFTAHHNQLYEYTGSITPSQITQPGSPSPAGPGSITALDRQVMRGSRIAFGVTDNTVGYVIAYRDQAFPAVGTIKAVANGDPAPTTVGGTLSFGSTTFDVDRKQVYFMSSVVGGSINQGIFRVKPSGAVQLIVGDGAPAPGGSTFLNFDQFKPLRQVRGVIVFVADLASIARGIYMMKVTGSPAMKIAEIGDPAPGTTSSFAEFGEIDQGVQRDVLFSAELADGSKGVWYYRGGVINPVAVDGQVAPGTGGGTFAIASLNNVPEVPLGIGVNNTPVFVAQVLNGTVLEGIFKSDPVAGLSAVLLQGAPVASIGLGTFDAFDSGESYMSVNNIDAMGRISMIASSFHNGVFAVQY